MANCWTAEFGCFSEFKYAFFRTLHSFYMSSDLFLIPSCSSGMSYKCGTWATNFLVCLRSNYNKIPIHTIYLPSYAYFISVFCSQLRIDLGWHWFQNLFLISISFEICWLSKSSLWLTLRRYSFYLHAYYNAQYAFRQIITSHYMWHLHMPNKELTHICRYYSEKVHN